MANTIEKKWWKRWIKKLDHLASYVVTPPARERYRLQREAENELYGTTKTNKAGED